MTDDLKKAEAQLKKLSERLHKGWNKLHPVTEKHLSIVRGAFKEQQKKQELKVGQKNSAAKDKAKKTKSRGHDHSH